MKINLKSVLLANAVFSGASGLAMALAHNRLAGYIDLEVPIALIVTGLALMLFSAFLFWLRAKENLPGMLVTTVIIQDLLWVLGSILIVVFKPFGLTGSGHALIGIVAIVVFGFAVLQYVFSPGSSKQDHSHF